MIPAGVGNKHLERREAIFPESSIAQEGFCMG